MISHLQNLMKKKTGQYWDLNSYFCQQKIKMKKILITCFTFSVLIACNNSSSKEKDNKTADVVKDNSTNPDYQNGLALVAKNKCMTCHTIDEPLTGPPYREVAKKYSSMPDTIVSHLASKIISGGNGIWGKIFMTPNPDI